MRQFAACMLWVRALRACVLWTSTSLPGSMRPLLGLTQYLQYPSAEVGSKGLVRGVLLGSRGFDL